MSKIERTIEFVKGLAANFGAKNGDLVSSYIFRNNTKEDALNQGGAFFGLISPDEEASGPYHDFSLVIFPDKDDKPWIISLVVGTLGFKNDYELAALPGVRRLFSSIVSEDGFCKTSFLDIESNLLKQIKTKVSNLDKSLQNYSKLISAYEIIWDPESENGKKIIAGFVAAYAQLRNFPRNSTQKKAVSKAITAVLKTEDVNEETEVLKLVLNRKFVVLQGAPGTGKTRLAKIVARDLNAEIFFTQFHAETSYSDFIYGIRPNLEAGSVSYVEQKGIFYESLKIANENPEKNIVLIIDEINRANLSNILGPIFYLFEYQLEDEEEPIYMDIGGGYRVNKVPSNYYVICTMNTADRSLAVVDFALRRRFAWYSLKPKEIGSVDQRQFFRDDFREFSRIFNLYASSEELSLQPGQAYFIAKTKEEMEDRIKYELLPLIREYLVEGLLINSKDEFSKYFYDRVGEGLFE
ncbi:McrB family protein [Methanosarcina mazei]|uniref:ATPase n=1 Tax=Methanosarcina mazei TaxID=2209 RepID=A0A0F8FXH4_METMZ|nr:AAA family ATPase [Methanosarcina mazei]KKF98732.1 ATPase [Methanosarcina mazei]KKG53438.1 ATPase [Methanosarcina mazei]KKG57847.1 ATPase [Methanosarcina mazei]KKG66881.1 ATPase [Methanosarcina mazei]KKH01162.1 ATPase [Methanosarcina mazei]